LRVGMPFKTEENINALVSFLKVLSFSLFIYSLCQSDF